MSGGILLDLQHLVAAFCRWNILVTQHAVSAFGIYMSRNIAGSSIHNT